MKNTVAFLESWWLSLLWLATVIGAVVAVATWDADTVLKAGVVGVLVGAPAVVAAFRLGFTLAATSAGEAGQAETWELSGIVRVVTRQQEIARLPFPELLGAAKVELLVSGVTLSQFRLHRKLILDKVRSGCTLRILLPDPRDRPLFDKLGILFDPFEWHAQVVQEFIACLETLKGLWKRTEGGRFHVRLYSLIPLCSVVIADNQIGVIESYAYDVRTEERVLLELRDGEVLQQYRRHFESMWHSARELVSPADFDEAIEAAARASGGPAA